MSRKQKDAAVAQSVVRRIGSAEVTGPIPVSSFVNCLRLRATLPVRKLLHGS